MAKIRVRRAARTKRDSVTNLYQHCRVTNTCPDDVKNKVEGTTWADTFLKWLSGLVYFGGAGISTGRGTGGSTGYTPLGGTGGGRLGSGGQVLRPSFPAEPVGPLDPLVIDAVQPTDSSVLDPILIDSGTSGVPDAPAGGEVIELEPLGPQKTPEDTVVTESNPTLDVPSTSTPAVVTHDTTVVDIRPPRGGVRSTPFTFYNPLFEPSISSSISSDVVGGNIFDTAQVAEGGELIELQTFQTSTPEPRPPTRPRRPPFSRQPYHRFIKQVPASVSRVHAGISRPFYFENPAFQDSIEGISEGINLNNEDADISRFGDPVYSSTAAGRVRISRLGQVEGMTMRSGARTGQHVHLFADLSTINHADSIELDTLGSGSNAGAAEFSVVDLEEPIEYSDAVLLDGVDEAADFSNSRLRLTDDFSEFSVPSLPEIPETVGGAYFVPPDPIHTSIDSHPQFVPKPLFPGATIIPILVTVEASTDFLWDPSLFWKRRRKSLFL